MSNSNLKSIAAVFAAVFTVTACGGGGGGGSVASTPPPPVSPPPSTLANVTIFPDPAAGQFASVGASVSGLGGNLDTYASADSRFGNVSGANSEQPHIRYASGGYYEIEMPGVEWDRLVPYKGLADPPSDNNYFQPQSVAQNTGYLTTHNSRLLGYTYSELGSWSSLAAGSSGYIAFGVPTPAGGVPATGSATYNGIVSGSADIMSADTLYGGYYPRGVDGTVRLDFDFAKGLLNGAMNLSLNGGMNPIGLGKFDFAQTVFAVGSPTYSGKFETDAVGDNFFTGSFTGPHAEEAIGAWALPFVFNVGDDIVPADHQTHQAFGAWIAKKP